MRDGFKVLTHDYCPPIMGGDPVWDGVSKKLGKVELDTSPATCAPGWHFCAEAHTALWYGGLWPAGKPSVLLRVRGGKDTIQRGDQMRCSRLTIIGVCDEDEVAAAVRVLSATFGRHAERMAREQMRWREALARPYHDPDAVERHLRDALRARGLRNRRLRRFARPGEVMAAVTERKAWGHREAWTAWGEWDAERSLYSASPSWAPSWAAWGSWDTNSARDARAALTAHYAALAGWANNDPDLLSTGLRDAYLRGLGYAAPIGPRALGWAMETQ